MAAPVAYECSQARGGIRAAAYTAATATWIRDASMNYATTCGNTRSLTLWVRPRDRTHILMDTSRVLNLLSHIWNAKKFLISK